MLICNIVCRICLVWFGEHKPLHTDCVGSLFTDLLTLHTVSWIFRIAIWAENKYIVGGLVFVILGHWSLILQGSALCLQSFIPTLKNSA